MTVRYAVSSRALNRLCARTVIGVLITLTGFAGIGTSAALVVGRSSADSAPPAGLTSSSTPPTPTSSTTTTTTPTTSTTTTTTSTSTTTTPTTTAAKTPVVPSNSAADAAPPNAPAVVVQVGAPEVPSTASMATPAAPELVQLPTTGRDTSTLAWLEALFVGFGITTLSAPRRSRRRS